MCYTVIARQSKRCFIVRVIVLYVSETVVFFIRMYILEVVGKV